MKDELTKPSPGKVILDLTDDLMEHVTWGLIREFPKLDEDAVLNLVEACKLEQLACELVVACLVMEERMGVNDE